MSKSLTIFLTIVTIALGLLGTLTWVVMIFAGMPNSKPEQLVFLRNLMIACGVGGLVATGAGAWMISLGYPWWGLLIGGVPILSFIVAVVYVSVS